MTGVIPHTDSFTIENPNPQRLPEGENAQPLETIGATASEKLVIFMVGLPGNGKTSTARRICRFLNFFHDIPTEIFDIGVYRRKLVGTNLPATFYDHTNAVNVAKRKEACDAAMKDMVKYMKQDGVRVAVYDSTNSSKDRRQFLLQRLRESGVGAKAMFLESICDDTKILATNIKKVHQLSPDYSGVDYNATVEDFMELRKMYENVYETLDESDGPHIKIINSKKYQVYNLRGYLPLKVCHFIMNLHTMPRTFYLTRHGQSEYNVLGKIGGDSGLSINGVEYARRLAQYAKDVISKEIIEDPNGEEIEVERPCRLWTSTLRRTIETSQFIDHTAISCKWDNDDVAEWIQFRSNARRNLDELYAGTFDGMTYKEIQENFPEEFERRQNDKLAYRYPRGESYMDVTLRLEPLAHEMERAREPVLVIGHQGILRIIFAYFMGLGREEAPYISIPLNTVIQLTPHPYGCHEKRICLMDKAEMLNDGQDEPVTSMPVKERKFVTQYSESDPVMNAPSC